MSRIGKQPILIPSGVSVFIEERKVKVDGPKGSLLRALPKRISLKQEDGKILVLVKGESKLSKSLHGTFRALINNMVTGVSRGFSKQLELVGTGFRAEVSGKTLILTVGYSHPVKIEAPEGISFKVEKTFVTVEGVDKEEVGLISSRIRSARPPEPYKGKGVKYVDEIIRRKPGKAAAKATGA